ncbi:Protein farnesyltransferase subunit beta [Quillaja saponaria]|uniref:Protein farnesyltransferase subunit beta n=1 Tax=Quillaja saponaria TaxID=32244 RepID=A0AAD7PX89_QUISA|nr:Protein farnesyltransferase subunit beta [Quillaja saponaria]
MKHPSGGFRIHDAEEIDVRACYTAIAVASILNILDNELVRNVGNYILRLMKVALPENLFRGSWYTFCGLATMVLIKEVDHLDLASLVDWLVFRQGKEC